MYYRKNWRQKLKAKLKLRKYAIRNLMTIIIVGMAAAFLLDVFSPIDFINLIEFNRDAIMRGQIWRLFSFIFIPPNTSFVFIIISLYFYWLIGLSLENEWGAFKFNIYYLCGIGGTIIAGMITGYATNFFINMSLFFAFAILNPNFQILVFYIIPVKIKYLAYIDAAFFLFMFISSGWPGRVALLVSILNLILFFGNGVVRKVKQVRRRGKWKKRILRKWGRRGIRKEYTPYELIYRRPNN